MNEKNTISTHISHSIDVLRGIASLGVIWGHSIYGLNIPIELNGAFWVWVFLPVSGFLVANGFITGRYNLSAAGYKSFLGNRFLRILPLSYLALAIGLIMQAVKGESLLQYLPQFYFAPKSNDMSLIGPMWTIAVELQFYVIAILVVPLIGMVCKVNKGWFDFLILCVVFYLTRIYVINFDPVWIQPRTLIGNLGYFVAGVLLAYSFHKRIFMTRAVLAKLLISFLLVGFAWWLQNFHSSTFWGKGIGGGGYIALAIVAINLMIDVDISTRSVGRNVFHQFSKMMKKIGTLCLGIYIWHAIILAMVNQFTAVPPGFLRLAMLLLAIPTAALSYKYFEKKFLKFKFFRRSESYTV